MRGKREKEQGRDYKRTIYMQKLNYYYFLQGAKATSSQLCFNFSLASLQ